MRFLYEAALKAVIRRRLLSDGIRPAVIKEAAIKFLDNHYSADEINSFRKIELIRERLNSSGKMITVTDYGAGSNGAGKAEESREDAVTLEKNLGQLSGKASKPEFWCRFIYSIAATLKPEKVLELGTCTGISAMYIASAILPSGGKLITIEGASSLAEIAKSGFAEAELNNIECITAKFSDHLPALLNGNNFELCFIDGHHKEEPTLQYFDLISGKMKSGSIILFDDISWSAGMKRAWKRIQDSPGVSFSAGLFEIGLVVVK